MIADSKPKKEASNSHRISKCDHLLYECLLLRDKECQMCGKTTTLVPSHCYGKKTYPALRHELLNLVLLCDDCHKWWHSNPIEAWEWFEEKYPDRFEHLQWAKNMFTKLNKLHYQERSLVLKEELNRLTTKTKEERNG